MEHLSRPVAKPPKRTFKTLLSLDGGGLRNIVSTMVLVEVEESVKRYLLANPDLLPKHAVISTAEDFDVELADYFDLMTGVSAGGWMTLYLASRGGQGVSRGVLDDPVIIEKYGFIPHGSARALIVFFKEFGEVIYPLSTLDFSAGPPLDPTNPLSVGVSKPVFTNEGILTAMEAFVGNMTMTDLDTSIMVPAFDMISGFTALFVMNAFGDVPVTSSTKMLSRFQPRSAGQSRFTPDLVFDEGADYYLKDVAAATGAVPRINPAMPISRVGNETVEFLGVDGAYPVDSAEMISAFFTSAENDFGGFEKTAIMSVGSGTALVDWTAFAGAGLAGWLQGSAVSGVVIYSGAVTADSLLDYFYYSNPESAPYQFLRIDKSAPAASADGIALTNGAFNSSLVDVNEAFGQRTAEEHRQVIDIFVRDFMFK